MRLRGFLRLTLRRLAVALSCAAAPLLATEPPATPTVPATATRVIYLVRHGAYTPDDRIAPRPGPGLSPLGVAQARLAGARLAALPFGFDAVVASPLTRTRETARVLAADLRGATVEIDPDLAECSPPTWRTEANTDQKPEEMAACAERLDALFARRFVPAKGNERHELFVAHGNVIRYLLTRAMRVDGKAWLEMSVGHASLSIVRVEPDGRCKVTAAGDVGHLPANLQTGAAGDPERKLEPPPD